MERTSANTAIDSIIIGSESRYWQHKYIKGESVPRCDIDNKVIYSPKFGPLVDEKDDAIVRGKNIHEAAHARLTPESKSSEWNALKRNVVNALEDCRIERSVSKLNPTVQNDLYVFEKYMSEELGKALSDPEKIKNVKPVDEALAAMMFRSQGYPINWNMTEKAQKYFDSAKDIFEEYKDLPNQDVKEGFYEIVKLADRVIEALKQANQKNKDEEQEEEKDNQKNQDKKDQKDKKDKNKKNQEKNSGSEDKKNNSEDKDKSSDKENSSDKDDKSSGKDKEDKENSSDKDKEDKGKSSGKNKKDNSEDKENKEDEEDEGSGESSDLDEDSEENESEKDGDEGEESDKKGKSKSKNKDSEEYDNSDYDNSEEDGDNSNKEHEHAPDGFEPQDNDFSKGKKSEKELEQELEKDCGGEDLKEKAVQEKMSQIFKDSVDESGGFTSYRELDRFVNVEEDVNAYEQARNKISVQIGRLSNYTEEALKFLSRNQKMSNLERGKIDKRKLHSLSKSLTKKVFYKTRDGIDLDCSVTILVDESGSIGNMQYALRTLAIAFSEVFQKLNINFEVLGYTTFGFSSSRSSSDGFDRTVPIKMKVYKTFKENYNLAKYRLGGIRSECHNADGESLLYAYGRLKKEHTRRKIVFVLSDGAPCCGEQDYKIGEHLKKVVKDIRNNGDEVYAFGIGTQAPERYYGKDFFIYLESIQELGPVFFNRFKEVIAKI